MLPGSEQVLFSSVDDPDHVLQDGVIIDLLILRRNAKLFAALATTNPVIPSLWSMEKIMENILDLDHKINIAYTPLGNLHLDASGGAAYFLGLFSLFTGRNLKDKVAVTAVVSQSGSLLEVGGLKVEDGAG